MGPKLLVNRNDVVLEWNLQVIILIADLLYACREILNILQITLRCPWLEILSVFLLLDVFDLEPDLIFLEGVWKALIVNP